MQRQPPHQLDEGYEGEETRSQSESDVFSPSDMNPTTQHLLALLLALPVEQRRHILEAGISSLSSTDKIAVGKYCSTLTHFDPVHYLPAELMLAVLSYLSPQDLLTASRVSLEWRQRSRDEKLWRICFAQEGWVMDRGKLDAYEERARARRSWRGAEVGEALVRQGVQRRGSKKRKTEEAFSSEGEAAVDAMTRHGSHGSEDSMEGVQGATHDPDTAVVRASASPSRQHTDERSPSHALASIYQSHAERFVPLEPELWRPNVSDARLSWPYLYKQRARLEKNWEMGRHKRFQLPLVEHADEGHLECVYAVQHTSKHLVSGSRDRTIRIWDLNTCRLKGQPLRGHDASVLCLQFDERPEHDIIVSGGSDNYVIIWKFSTGEILKKMEEAHTESVLNLRFDDRYIVTCSKDKSVRVFSRRALHKSDPLVPTHILPSLEETCGAIDARGMIAEFSLLTVFMGTQVGGHQAAVNAVQICGDVVISASGDRMIKSWSIDSGKLLRTFSGHTKGIACVQFDGRRIVSGSSDNTVRIFDSSTGAEVACLTQHESLVRTIQARFGDLNTVTDAELEDEANQASQDFFHALENGMAMPRCGTRHGRNAGSRRPEDMTATGTKVPPGGGGGKWAKIVSGSYDETIMIWKRDRVGDWKVVQRLDMDGVPKPPVNTARRRVGAAGAGQAGGQGQGQQQLQQIVGHAVAQTQNLAQQSIQQAQGNIALLQQGMQQGGAGGAQGTLHPPHTPFTAQGITAPSNFQAFLAQEATSTALPPHRPEDHPDLSPVDLISQQLQAHAAAHHQTLLAHQAAEAQVQAYLQAPLPGLPAAHGTQAQAPGLQGQHPLPHLLPHPHPQQPLAPHQPQPAFQQPQQLAPQQPQHQGHRETNRVFKLQFDARRLVACSQNRVIVGWDFANGDKELERVGGWCVETA
ncbi:hypothetical protein LTR62_005218 [Meristemomyces frigidus]|uniref:F-box domain-containing protein n=1 Tax=Meristemomyces frigidus TaxID=1508187 RepID=A0AAN7TQ43_9PEZI|nr:hypothetical protein LTR62_005218 [Meristemomyces frigidus]